MKLTNLLNSSAKTRICTGGGSSQKVFSNSNHNSIGLRYFCATLLLFIMGAGQMWASGGSEGTTITVYVSGDLFSYNSWNNSTSYIKIHVRRGDNDWMEYANMTATGDTYKGTPIYSFSFKEKYDGAEIWFEHWTTGGEERNAEYWTGGWKGTSEINGKLFLGYLDNVHRWGTLCKDATFYILKNGKTTSWASLYAHGWNAGYTAITTTFPGIQMSNTSKTYNSVPLYSVTLNNPPYSQVIFNQGNSTDQSGEQTVPGKEGKIFDYNADTWLDYYYDATVTVSSTDYGSVNEVGSVTLSATGTTLTATPTNSALHAFLGWTISGGGITPSSSTASSQSFKANGEGGTIRANFAKRWTIKGGNSDHAGDGADALGDWGVYNDFDNYATDAFIQKITLAASTTYKFKVVERGTSDTWYGNSGTINDGSENIGSAIDWVFADGGANCTLKSGDAGEYTFVWNASTKKLSVYFPGDDAKKTLTKQKYVYFDSRTETNWKEGDFNARFYFKYLATDVDLGNVTCNKGNALEDWVYYAAVPNNDYVGSVQMNRLDPSDNHMWDDANIIYARTRSNANQNCMVTPSSGWSGITLTWGTYCPPMSSVTLADNGTTTWGGNGESATPYLVPTGGDIKVHVTASASALDDANMTKYFLFKKEGSAVGSGSDATSKTITASGTTGTKEAVTVDAYNYYNSTEGTHLTSSSIYYEARTPYTISYNAGTGGSGERANETKLKDVAFSLPNSAIFERSGYTQTGWTKSDLGSQTHALGANYTDNSAQAFYPAWTPNPYTITLNNHDATSAGTSSVNVTFDANTNLTSAITIPKKTGYGFYGYYTEEGGAGTQIIDAEGNFIAGAGSNAYLDGSKNWKYANSPTLHAYWVASAVTTPVVNSAMPAYIGEDVKITLSTTSTHVAEPVVIFEVTDGSNSITYEVVATPGAIGSAPTYSTTHTATFTAKHAATYSVTAKVYSGKLIDNFDGALAHWKALDGGTFVADETNPAMQAGNGSDTVMKIIRGNEVWKTVQTKQAADNSTTTNWNYEYEYIYMSMYSTTARTPKLKYSDDSPGYEKELDANSLSAKTWQRKQFATTHDIDYILPFMLADGTMYIDDIILSNESSMTVQATSSSASTTITQPTIGSCTANAATTNWGGSNINISLSAQTTYLADAVVVFFITDGSNSIIYEVTATPGTPGDNNAITHTATFVAQHPATYSVTAKLYNGKFIDNFEGSASAWSGLGYGTCERVTNVKREADNGSTTVMKITRSTKDSYGETHQTAWTTTAENNGKKTAWGHEYGYIHMRYYAPQAETPEVEYWDDGVSVFKNTTLSSQTASTWHELVFAVNGGVVNYIHPFVLSGGKTDGHYIYIDDIILSNRSTWAPIQNTSAEDLTADASDVTIRDTYTVTLENLDADEEHKGTENVSVTYGATTGLTDAIDTPSKTHYEFGGYYVSNDGGSTLTETQLIDANGNWKKDVSGYTGASGDNATWLYADDITLYAKWTEITHTVTVAVSAEACEGTPGTVQISSEDVTEVTAGEVTWSALMTPIANPGWKFKEWQKSSNNVDLDLTSYHSDYQSSTDNSMRIKAYADDETLTAVFEPRYYLVGGEITGPADDGSGTSSGMPGWGNYTDTFKVISNSPILATCSLTLGHDKHFYIMVRDKVDGLSYGKSGAVSLGDGESIKFEDYENKVLFHSNGGDNYTFKITAVDGSGRPTVSVERPYQVNIGRKRVDIDGNDHDDDTGGTVDLSKQTAPETWTPISNGDWVPYGISVKYNASKEDGYTLDWYNASDYETWFSNADYWFHTATSTGNGYAKFTEISTSVTLANDGNGKVQIGDVDKTETTCGVTTHRTIVAVPNDGYKFSSWSKTSGSDYDLESTSSASTTLSGLGGGETSGQTVTANFDYRWQLKAESDGWGSSTFTISNISTNASGDAVGYVDITLSANTSYQFTIYDLQESATYKNGSDKVYYMTNGNSHNWGFGTDKTYNCGITTAGAGTYRFTWNITDKKLSVTYPNFVIYRTGDNGGENESYDGGTISQAIEFRMKVGVLDQWYSLCLPFTVSAVKVWDDEDEQYYDLVPYYRTGGKFYNGHYVIRTPESTTDFALANFGNWTDPDDPEDYVPSANTPYIIQWHDSYFLNRYVSFFGATGQTIPTSMTVGDAPSLNDVVNVYGNNSMTSGSVAGAYLLEGDYGGGAWLRLDNASTPRTINPFECYICANSTTTSKHLMLKRDMIITGIEEISQEPTANTRKVMMDGRLYILRGDRVYSTDGQLVK